MNLLVKIRRLLRRRSLGSVVAVAFIAAMVAGGVFVLWVSTFELPDVASFDSRQVTESTKIYDRTGKIVLYDVHGTVRRSVVPFEEISQNMKDAAVAIEDQGFYEHGGVEVSAILRAVWRNIGAGNLLGGQGGSTITQQVIKNSLLSSEKTLTRKIKEWVLAPRLEKILTKDQILAVYLNEIPYGGNVYGVEEASQRFYGKPAATLTVAEAAYLAAMQQAPTRYSPYGDHRDELEARKNLVVDRMRENGFITDEEREAAGAQKIDFQKPETYGIKAPHFVIYVREQLEERFGQEAVERGGLKVITTLDWKLEEKGEEIAKAWALKNEQTFNAENASIVAVDPKPGQILAMVGSRDYFDEGIEGNYNIAVAERQPGSAMKPIVYAEAFEKGFRPETVVYDVPTQFSATCESGGDCYAPQNYDTAFRGPMTLRNALAQSVNVASVKVLYLAGIEDAIALAQRMGLSTIGDASRYGLSLVLGGGEVKPIEMASAYGVFAALGVQRDLVSVLRVEDRSGNVLEEWEDEPGEQVLSPGAAALVSDILSDNDARAPAFGNSSYLHFPNREVAVKTGTTNDYRDAWIVGYTPSISVAAWAGNNDNHPMEKKVAGFIVAPMWHEFMEAALAGLPTETFPEPPPLPAGLKPAVAGQPAGGREQHEILHWVDVRDPLGPSPQNPARDPQYSLWETALRGWLSGGASTSTPATGVQLRVEIVSPKNKAVVRREDGVDVAADTGGLVSSSEGYVGAQLVGSLGAGGRIAIPPSAFVGRSGEVTVTVSVGNESGKSASDSVEVRVR